jgi:Bacterial low temperature requirement A protein (LtrA)
MWWIYYVLPAAEVLHRHRDRSFGWGYGQMFVIAAIVATGAGLHAAAYFIEGEAHIGPLATLLCVAIPVSIYIGSIYSQYYYLVRRFDFFHIWLLLGTAGIVALAVTAAVAGVSMPICLLILTLAPAVTVIGYEVRGHRHQAEVLAMEEAEHASRST